ncbi:MAG: UvrD-helicase domain-containing protein [Chloroflexota bacterium]|nr:UvrD-helicase domain-containing protein [Chloroflexota bacterium]
MNLDWLDHLNPAQRQAVTSTNGPLLIVAGPGSGKTRVIVHRIAYLLQAEGVEPYHVLAVTFTNKAAREMKERLEGLIGERRARLLSVGTFHATCARWLRIDGERLGLDRRFAILDDADQVSTMKQVLGDLEIDEKRFSPRAILSAISAAKSELASPERYAARAEGLWPNVVARAYVRYQERLTELRALDFDDLLGLTVELLREHPDVLEKYQERYRYIMVDEFQDTNVAQYQLIRLLGMKHQNVCVVGDEDQSIYGWRKADVRNLVHFERDFPEVGIIMLEQNYRSTQTILDVASAVIAPNLGRKPKRLWTDNPRGVPPVLHEAYDERDEALFVVRQVEALRRAGGQYRDVAVAYRTNAQSRVLEEVLVRYGVPYRIVGGTRFYERREIKDLVAYLRLVANPADNLSFQRIVNVPARGIGKSTLSDLIGVAARLAVPLYEAARLAAEEETEIGPDGRLGPVVPLATRPRKLLAQFVATIGEARRRREAESPSAVLDFLLERIGYREHLRDGTEEGEERWQNVEALRTKLHDYDNMEPGDALEAFLEEAALVQDVDSLSEGATDAVTLITLHAAKGLEFPFVFIVGLEEKLCPHVRSMESVEQLAEERRLLYVGITRAMRQLFLVHAFRRTMYGADEPSEPSRFLADIPPQLLDTSASHAAGSGRPLHRAMRSGWGEPRSVPEGRVFGRRVDEPSRPIRAAGGPRAPRSYPEAVDAQATLDLRIPDDGADGAAVRRTAMGNTPPPASRSMDDRGAAGTPLGAAILGKLGGASERRTPTFRARDRVRHAEYGEGEVLASSFAGREELVLVRFDVRPDKPKNLSLSIHTLERTS